MPAILLKHEPNNLDSAEALGISLQISGHTHRAQMWPFMFVARKAYHGFDYGFKKHHSLEVLVSSGAGTWGPPMRLGTSSEIVVVTLERAK